MLRASVRDLLERLSVLRWATLRRVVLRIQEVPVIARRAFVIALVAGCGGSVASEAPRTGLRAVQISVGGSHACVLMSDGTVRCWGSNIRGLLGNGMTDETCTRDVRVPMCALTPTPVAGLDHVVQVSAGWFATCALRDNGEVWCWGTVAASGDAAPTEHPLPVLMPGMPPNAVEVEVGPSTTCVRTSGGEVWCAGIDFAGPAPIPFHVETRRIEAITNAAQIGVGYFNACVRLTDGRVQCWGWNTTCALFLPERLHRIG